MTASIAQRFAFLDPPTTRFDTLVMKLAEVDYQRAQRLRRAMEMTAIGDRCYSSDGRWELWRVANARFYIREVETGCCWEAHGNNRLGDVVLAAVCVIICREKEKGRKRHFMSPIDEFPTKDPFAYLDDEA